MGQINCLMRFFSPIHFLTEYIFLQIHVLQIQSSLCFTNPCHVLQTVYVLQIQSMFYKSSPVHVLQIQSIQIQSLFYKTSPVHVLQIQSMFYNMLAKNAQNWGGGGGGMRNLEFLLTFYAQLLFIYGQCVDYCK